MSQPVILDIRDRSAGRRVYGEAAKEETTEEEIENENESAKCKVQSAKVESEKATEEQSDKEKERENRDSPDSRVDFPDPVSAMT